MLIIKLPQSTGDKMEQSRLQSLLQVQMHCLRLTRVLSLTALHLYFTSKLAVPCMLLASRGLQPSVQGEEELRLSYSSQQKHMLPWAELHLPALASCSSHAINYPAGLQHSMCHPSSLWSPSSSHTSYLSWTASWVWVKLGASPCFSPRTPMTLTSSGQTMRHIHILSGFHTQNFRSIPG